MRAGVWWALSGVVMSSVVRGRRFAGAGVQSEVGVAVVESVMRGKGFAGVAAWGGGSIG
jgi:hypothetical protein